MDGGGGIDAAPLLLLVLAPALAIRHTIRARRHVLVPAESALMYVCCAP